MNGKRPLKVRDCMTTDPATVECGDSLTRASELLRRRDIRSVPVLEQGRLVGIVTDRDVRPVAAGLPLLGDEAENRRYKESLTVSAAMTADPLTIAPDALLVEAAKLFETYRISSLPVLEGDKLVGLLSITDLLKAFVAQNDGV
jgi:acetoin utilization protein AcuB